MIFLCNPGDSKKEPQQQLRFKMTTHEKTWKKKTKKQTTPHRHKTRTFNFENNTNKSNQKKSQVLFASYVPDSHKYYISKTFLPPAPDYRVR